MSWGESEPLQTHVVQDAGSNATFDRAGMLIKPNFSENTQFNSFLLVQVYENNTLHDDLIGEAEIDMAPMFWDKMKKISCDILDRSNKNAGRVILDLRLRSKFYTTETDTAILATPNIKLCLKNL